MPRIRTIKPELWENHKVGRVSRDARLFFIGMLNQADDEGRLRWNAKRLAGAIFGFDDDITATEIEHLGTELERAHLIQRYTIAGADYCAITGFLEHQKIDKRTPSRLPEPPEPATMATIQNPPNFPAGSPNFPGDSPNFSGEPPNFSEIPPDGKERKGKEEEGKGSLAPTAQKRDPLWDSIIDCWQLDTTELTKAERDRLNAAVKQLRDVHADPNEIPARRHMYALLFPTAAQTPMALVNRWAECRPDPTRLPVVTPKAASAITRAIGRAL